jgi:hypothetical protein
MIRSPEIFAAFLDSLMGGETVEQAARNAGASHHSTVYNWRTASKKAAANRDADSPFFFCWPSDSPPQWFHKHYKLAFDRRKSIFLRSGWKDFTHGRFHVVNGRIRRSGG